MRIGPARPIKKHGIQDFEFIKPISRGAFGRVFLAKNRNTGDLYAVKVLNKRQAVQKNQVAHIKTERSIHCKYYYIRRQRVGLNMEKDVSLLFICTCYYSLTSQDILSHTFNPFLVQFFYSFQTKVRLQSFCDLFAYYWYSKTCIWLWSSYQEATCTHCLEHWVVSPRIWHACT